MPKSLCGSSQIDRERERETELEKVDAIQRVSDTDIARFFQVLYFPIYRHMLQTNYYDWLRMIFGAPYWFNFYFERPHAHPYVQYFNRKPKSLVVWVGET